MTTSSDIRKLAAASMAALCTSMQCPCHLQTNAAPTACPFEHECDNGKIVKLPCDRVVATDWLGYFDQGLGQ